MSAAKPNSNPLRIARVITLLLSLLATLLFSACRPLPTPRPTMASPAAQAPRKLLFVGDSFTFCNGGLENHVKQLAASARPPRSLEAESATQGGATLKVLYGKQSIRDKIRDGGCDVVILQDDIPELTEHSAAPFFEYARLFDREIRGAGGKTVLFMAWPYERLNWVTLAEIDQAHRDLGHELGVSVAPVGVAFQRALAARPALAMLGGDKEHESIHGTYLAANVIYATLFGESPVGFKYCPTGVSAEEAAFLQRMAWETVQAWPTTRPRRPCRAFWPTSSRPATPTATACPSGPGSRRASPKSW